MALEDELLQSEYQEFLDGLSLSTKNYFLRLQKVFNFYETLDTKLKKESNNKYILTKQRKNECIQLLIESEEKSNYISLIAKKSQISLHEVGIYISLYDDKVNFEIKRDSKIPIKTKSAFLPLIDYLKQELGI